FWTRKESYWKIVPLFILVAGDMILLNMNILLLHNDWKLSYFICLRVVSLVMIMLLENFTLKRVKV
ncbi:MAG TPA: hypothetical protein VE710_12530, partial [Candidatus Bathyarchaeia archaeon]|nr:hypothetical protein [Candidatus Bathyarchaeia archaeon]